VIFQDLREFLTAVEDLGELRRLHGAHWDVEIGAITEVVAERNGPMLLFDDIPDYPSGYRLTTNAFGSFDRTALALNMPLGLSGIEMIDLWRQRVRHFHPVPPRYVESGPILENVVEGKSVDLWQLPAPKWHDTDGGRFIGTGNMVITRNKSGDWVNLGPYRMMVYDRDRATINVVRGKHGRFHMDEFHALGEGCPVAVTLGQEPALWAISSYNVPSGVSEYDFTGWLRDCPVEVVESGMTGLPIPATAEIVLEGEILPTDVEMHGEGPFGEWAGYSTGGPDRPVPVMQVKRVLFRDDPIEFGVPPLKPPLIWHMAMPFRAAAVWDQLIGSGQTGITGVWQLVTNSGPLFLVIAIKQQFAGHAKMVGAAAAACRAGAYGGKFIVVVDDDIDITDPNDVLWAMATRADIDNVDILHKIWTSRSDEALTPEVRYSHPVSSRLIIDACRSFAHRSTQSAVCQFDRGFKQQIAQKWQL
jgi:UbiD family decarboxylase